MVLGGWSLVLTGARQTPVGDVPRKISHPGMQPRKLFGATGVIPDVMKTFLLTLSLALAGVGTGRAQIYHPAVVNGSILGGIVGAVVGGHNHDRWGEGAVIGAAAGALLGAAVEPPRTVVYQQPPVTVVQAAPTMPMAATVPNAPVVGTATPVVVQQPAQVVYVPYYEPAPVVYAYPSISVGVGYAWGPRHYGYAGRGYRRW